jgi:hypothetical protein
LNRNRLSETPKFAGPMALVAVEPGEAHGGAQFPQLGLLFRGDAQGFAIQSLGGLRIPSLAALAGAGQPTQPNPGTDALAAAPKPLLSLAVPQLTQSGGSNLMPVPLGLGS